MSQLKGGRVKSVERALKIIETIQEQNGAGVSELAEELDTAKSTIHGYLSTLHDHGYLVKEGNSYDIGMKFLRLGEYSRTRKDEFELAEQKVEELAERTDERAQFIIEEMGQGVFVYRDFGTHAVETDSETGKRMFLHLTSAGKAILANLPEQRVHDIIDQWGLPALTDNTITDKGKLLEELAEIRKRGYAFNKGENIQGLNAIGTAVMGEDGRVIGALSISGPTHRMKGAWMKEELPNLLLGTANEMELKVTYS